MKILKKKKIAGLLMLLVLFFVILGTNISFAADTLVPGTTDPGGIVQCGRGGQNMCTLCDIIRGFKTIIDYIIRIAVGIFLAAVTIGGAIYVTSVGNPKMIETAKDAMKFAAIGFIIILTGWLIITTLLYVIGASSGLGINGVTGWWNFNCAAVPNR